MDRDLNFVFLIFTVILIGSITAAETAKDVLKFTWYDGVTAEKLKVPSLMSQQGNYLIKNNDVYRETQGNLILQSTNFSLEYSSAIGYVPSPGFVETVFYSYRNHHNLIIRPDDVWTAIMIQFSLYVNANAEQLRHEFVNFEGKKNLEVEFTAPVDEVPIDVFITKIVNLIKDNIDPTVSNWVLPNFTTTTENDRLTAGAAMMATLQKYFDYTLSLVLCGIPELTILGNVEDWKEIRKRIDELKKFELNNESNMLNWSKMLGIILDEFINVKEGKPKDAEFWKDAIRVDYELRYLGCYQTNETILNGWITAFSAFDKNGRWHKDSPFDNMENNRQKYNKWLSIETAKITRGVVQVPIKIKDEYARPEEKEYNGAIYAGHFGYSVQEDQFTLQPVSGWAMAITSNPPEYIRKKM